ncbi:uncharacterized protein ACRADG_010554 [Cochliomyia hominivorax]
MNLSFNRYNFGMVFGGISFLLSLSYFVVVCVNFSGTEKERQKDITLIIFTSLSALVSLVFIWAILKRNYKLIYPWILLSLTGILICGKILVVYTMRIINGTMDVSEYAEELVLYSIGLVTEIAIFGFSYDLFKEMKKDATDSINTPNGSPKNADEYSAIPAEKTDD